MYLTNCGPNPSLGSGSQEYECFEADEESEVTDVNLEPEQMQDRPKALDEELIEVNLGGEGREAQSMC